MTTELADFYEIPSLYDILYTPGTADEVDVMQRIVRDHVRTGSRAPSWLEPACGTGRYMRVLAGRGVRVHGFDRSEAMVAYAKRSARRRGLEGLMRAHVADMTDFRPGLGRSRFDFAFNPVNTIRHLGTDRELVAHLDEVAAVLRPGGVYAIGLSLSRYRRQGPLQDVWEGRRGRCEVTQLVRYRPPATPQASRKRVEHVESHLTVVRPGGTSWVTSSYDLRCYDLAQWRRAVGRSRMAIAEVVDVDGRSCDPVDGDYQTFLLRRKEDRR